jgi:hypothetical protein
MGDEKWRRRRPGRVSGTVVPPPVQDDPPPLPHRRNQTRIRNHVGPSGDAGSPDTELHDYRLPEPKLPDNVRLLFQPVIRARDANSGTEGRRASDSRPGRTAVLPGTLGATSHPVHGPVLRDLARSEDWSASAPERRGKRGRRGRQADGRGTSVPGQRSPGAASPRHGTAGPGHRRHVAWLAALTVLVLLSAAGTTVALLGQRAASQQAAGGSHDNPVGGGGGGNALSAGGTALAGAATARTVTSQWVAREISRTEIIGCDTVMCGALIRAGVPSGDLMVIRPDAQDPLGADVIVATPVLRSQFGARLSATYAPAVLASFGSGAARIDVRVIATYGASAYQLALNRDLAARELLGTQIVGNSRIALPPEAQTELAAGQVDPRLLITLPALAQQHAIRVIAFYGRAPGASSGVPLSGVKLAGADPPSGLNSRAYLRWMINFLRSQRSLYRATYISAAGQRGRAVVFVRFTQPYPIGLLH